MAEAGTKLPVKAETTAAARSPLINLRQAVDRLFNDFDGRFWPGSFGRRFFDEFRFNHSALKVPAVDIAEKEAAFERTSKSASVMVGW